MRRPIVTTAELPNLLRRARVDGAAVGLRGLGSHGAASAGAPSDRAVLRLDAHGAGVVLDTTNGIAEIDGALTLSAAARRIARLGGVFPLARPLPPLTLTEACAALPLFVDAFVQQATLLTGDGDPADTPRAPRAAAGPSLLGALCSRPPLAIAVRARVRVMLATHAVVRTEKLASTRDVAVRVRDLLDEGRAFTVDAFGTTILVLGGVPSAGPSTSTASVAPSAVATSASTSTERQFAHAGNGRRASFSRAVSFAPGDVDAMTRALDDGHRVVAAPYIGRCGALVRGFEPLAIVDVARGVAALTSSWIPNASTAGAAERSAGAHAARRETP